MEKDKPRNTTRNRRDFTEWHSAIMTIILQHDNHCLLNPTLYTEIQKFIKLTEHEKEGSGEVKENIFRGTLRGYLSKMVKNNFLKKYSENRNKVWYSVADPEQNNYLLENATDRMSDPSFYSTLKYGNIK